MRPTFPNIDPRSESSARPSSARRGALENQGNKIVNDDIIEEKNLKNYDLRNLSHHTQFKQNVQKSEGGSQADEKPAKVEVTISIDGVAIQEPKNCGGRVREQFPIHRIAFCDTAAQDAKMVCFIAKADAAHKHRNGASSSSSSSTASASSSSFCCHVFAAAKAQLAEELVLTIAEAIALAYQRYKSTSTTERELRKQLLLMEKRIGFLETENAVLRRQLKQVGIDVGPTSATTETASPRQVSSNGSATASIEQRNSGAQQSSTTQSNSAGVQSQSGSDKRPGETPPLLDMSTPEPQHKKLSVAGSSGDYTFDDDFDQIVSAVPPLPPRRGDSSGAVLQPPPQQQQQQQQLAAGPSSSFAPPPNGVPPPQADPFGHGDFGKMHL